MKGLNTHAILSDVYRILSTYSASDLNSASGYDCVAPSVAEALRALAREAERASGGPSRQETGHRSRARGPHDGGRSTEIPELLHKSHIADLIRRSVRFDSTGSILAYARDIGLRIEMRPKDSKERVARRLAEAIDKAPEPRRGQILGGLLRGADSQTQGWIDVIKSTQQ